MLTGAVIDPSVTLVLREVHRADSHLFAHYEVGG